MMLTVHVTAPQFSCFPREVLGTAVARTQQDAVHARHGDSFTPFDFLIKPRNTDRGRDRNIVQGMT
jgi:hypothetical protein